MSYDVTFELGDGATVSSDHHTMTEALDASVVFMANNRQGPKTPIISGVLARNGQVLYRLKHEQWVKASLLA
jgi:hypothetical protein